MTQEKRIEAVEVMVGDLKFGFENPRKITPTKMRELEQSIEQHGDFGVIVIDENNNVISGTQRVKAMLRSDRDTPVLCKRLIGYSVAELRLVNIKANTHAGDWNLDILAKWTADMGEDFGMKESLLDAENLKHKDMELIRYESYDYVMIVCRNSVDYLHLCQRLGIDDKKVIIAQNKTGDRKIKARAIWYDQMQAQITEKNQKTPTL